MQNPNEIVDLIFELKKYEKLKNIKFRIFLKLVSATESITQF